jgi:cell division transport system permease protein
MTGKPIRRRGPSILPPDAGPPGFGFLALASLSFVASMLAIVCVAAGGGVADWRGRLIGSATVAVAASGLESPDAAAARAAEALGAVAGVARAWPLAPDGVDPAILRLELGDARRDGRLVAVKFKAGSPPADGALARALDADGLIAHVDDHRPWTSPLGRAAAWAALAVAATLTAIIGAVGVIAALATRGRLVARRDLVDLLRLAGAADGFIGGLFAARSAKTAARAGALGALAAALVVAAWRMSGERPLLLGGVRVAWADLAAAGAWPLMAALVGAAAARLTARAALHGRP